MSKYVYNKEDLISAMEYQRDNPKKSPVDLIKSWPDYNKERLTKKERSELKGYKVSEYDLSEESKLIILQDNNQRLQWRKPLEKCIGDTEYISFASENDYTLLYTITNPNSLPQPKFKGDKYAAVFSASVFEEGDIKLIWCPAIVDEDEDYDKYVMDQVKSEFYETHIGLRDYGYDYTFIELMIPNNFSYDAESLVKFLEKRNG